MVEKPEPGLVKVEKEKEDSDEVEIEFVSPAIQLMEPLVLRVSKKITMAVVKKLVVDAHPDKPSPGSQKIIYKGR